MHSLTTMAAAASSAVLKLSKELLMAVRVMAVPTSLILRDRFASIVLLPHLLVGQHFVRFGNVLEFLLGLLLFLLIHLVRMPPKGQVSVRLLDVLTRGGPRHAEDLVVVLLLALLQGDLRLLQALLTFLLPVVRFELHGLPESVDGILKVLRRGMGIAEGKEPVQSFSHFHMLIGRVDRLLVFTQGRIALGDVQQGRSDEGGMGRVQPNGRIPVADRLFVVAGPQGIVRSLLLLLQRLDGLVAGLAPLVLRVELEALPEVRDGGVVLAQPEVGLAAKLVRLDVVGVGLEDLSRVRHGAVVVPRVVLGLALHEEQVGGLLHVTERRGKVLDGRLPVAVGVGPLGRVDLPAALQGLPLRLVPVDRDGPAGGLGRLRLQRGVVLHGHVALAERHEEPGLLLAILNVGVVQLQRPGQVPEGLAQLPLPVPHLEQLVVVGGDVRFEVDGLLVVPGGLLVSPLGQGHLPEGPELAGGLLLPAGLPGLLLVGAAGAATRAVVGHGGPASILGRGQVQQRRDRQPADEGGGHCSHEYLPDLPWNGIFGRHVASGDRDGAWMCVWSRANWSRAARMTHKS